MQTVRLAYDGEKARQPGRVAYCEPYAAPWSREAPPDAKITLILDDGPHVARVELADGSAYLLTRGGDKVAVGSGAPRATTGDQAKIP